MIGLCGLSVFIGALLARGWGGPESFRYAMTRCCATVVSLFGGYFLAAWAVNEVRARWLRIGNDMQLARCFAGYAFVVTFVLQAVVGVLPDFSIIAWFVEFYTVYIVWAGSRQLMQVPERLRLRFTIVSSVLLIACPLAVRLLFDALAPSLDS